MVTVMHQVPRVLSRNEEPYNAILLKCNSHDMPMTVRQDRLFTNEKNKARFIQGLSKHMVQAGVNVYQAEADAAVLFVLQQ
jgi:hypothetical protein